MSIWSAVCEAKPTTLKHPSPGEGLRITCLVSTIKEAQNLTWVFRQCNLLIPFQEFKCTLPLTHPLECVPLYK